MLLFAGKLPTIHSLGILVLDKLFCIPEYVLPTIQNDFSHSVSAGWVFTRMPGTDF